MDNYPDLDSNEEEYGEKLKEDPMEKAFLCVIGAFVLFGGYLYIASNYFS
jgi:hypothetical protein